MTSTQHVRVEGTSYQRGPAVRHPGRVQRLRAGPGPGSDPADHPREQGTIIASVLMDLNARHLWLAAGHPCRVPYERLDVVL
jgi:hypothetical protein